MQLTLHDIKKAPREVLHLVELAKNMEDVHNARRGFFPTLVNDALRNPESSLRKALADFKAAMKTAEPLETNAEETTDIRIALQNLNEIYDALESGDIYDVAEPIFQLPAYYRALQRFLEPSIQAEAERKTQQTRNAMTQEEKDRMWNLMFEQSSIFNAEGGSRGRSRRRRQRGSSKRSKRSRRGRSRRHGSSKRSKRNQRR